MTVYCANHKKHVNISWGPNADICNIKASGINNYDPAL